MKILLLILFATGTWPLFAQADIYQINIKGLKADSIRFEDFRGKMILVVNTASDSSRDQLEHLETLHKEYSDSGLVILAVPSNDFGNERGEGQLLRERYQSFQFIVGDIHHVTGQAQSELYKWLTQAERNGVTDNPIKGDYKKFLVNREGRLVAAFDEKSTVRDVFFMHSFLANQ